MFCSKCGKEIGNDAKFCGFCGARNEFAAQFSQTPPAPPIPPVPPVPPIPPVPPVPPIPPVPPTPPVPLVAPVPQAAEVQPVQPVQEEEATILFEPRTSNIPVQEAPAPAPAQTFVPPAQEAPAPAPAQTFVPPVQEAPAPAPAQTFVPPAQEAPAPAPAQTFVPPAQEAPAPAPAQTFVPPVQEAPAPAPAQTFVPPVQEAPAPAPAQTFVPPVQEAPAPAPAQTFVPPVQEAPASAPAQTFVPPVQEAPAPAPLAEKPKGFSNKKKFIIIGAAAVVGLGALGAGAAYFITSRNSADKLVELANKYLESGEYDKAIIEFEKILTMDEKCVDAYIGIARAYIGLGKEDIAIKYLQDGLRITGDPKLQEMLDGMAPVESSEAPAETQPEEPVEEPVEATYGLVTVAEDGDVTGHFTDITGSFDNTGTDIYASERNGRFGLSTISGGTGNYTYAYISPFFGSGDNSYAFVSTTWDGYRRYTSSDLSWIIDRSGDKVMGIPLCYNVWWGSSPDPVVVVQDYGGYRISGIDGKTLMTLPAEFIEEESAVPEFLRSGFAERNKSSGKGSVMTTGCAVYDGELYFTFTELHEKNGSTTAMYYTYKLALSGATVDFEEYDVTAETGAPFPVYSDGTVSISAINGGDSFRLLKTEGNSTKFCGSGPSDEDMRIAKVFDADHVLVCRTVSDGVVASTEYAVYKPEWYSDEYETAAQNMGAWTQLSDWYQSISPADGSVWVAQTASGSVLLDPAFRQMDTYKLATRFSGGVAIVCTGSTGVLVDENGNRVSEEFPCESASALSDGYFSILSNGAYSLVRAEKK